jgi:ADP-heptose:LPS heptosyltransferase
VNDTKPHILIIKLSAIGDVIHSLPVLEVIRDRFPAPKIDWVAERYPSSEAEVILT